MKALHILGRTLVTLVCIVVPVVWAAYDTFPEATTDGWVAPDFSQVPIADHRMKDRVAFLFFGDAGSGNATQRQVGASMLRVAKEYRCDFALMLGDNMYTNIWHPGDRGFTDRFEEPYGGFRDLGRFDFWGVLGNHDNNGNWRAQITRSFQSDLWRMPDLNYAVPNLPEWLQIVGIYTDPITYSPFWRSNPEGLAMLERGRACFKTQSPRGWRIVFGHHPLWASSRGGLPSIQRDLLPFLEDTDAHVYLCGHTHLQEHVTGYGFEQFIQGAAGDPRHDRLKGIPDAEHATSRFENSEAGFGVAEVTRDRLTVRFFNADGMSIYEWSSTYWDPATRRGST